MIKPKINLRPKPKRKRGIFSKLFLAFLIVVLLSLTIAGISFAIMIKGYIIDEAKRNLLEEGKSISATLGAITDVMDLDEEFMSKARKLTILSKNITVNFAIIDNNDNVVYGKYNPNDLNIKYIDKKIIESVRKTNEPITRMEKQGKDFLIAAIPINSKFGEVKAVGVLFTPVKGLDVITHSIFKMLIISLVISVVIVLLIAYLFALKISKPINALKEKTEKVSRRDFDIQKTVNTGDEIEELDESFDRMTQKIKEYDNSQKLFLQNISHELKTPLMSIQGYAEAIKDGIIEYEDLDKSLDIIIDESQRLKRLVDEIIMLTKLESMDEIYNFEKVLINDIIKDTIDRVKSLTLKRDIIIKLNEEEEIYSIADKDRLSQVIINIVGNGIRYAKSIIQINILREKRNAVIEIENDGEKLNESDAENMFKRFYKGNNQGQTGLGLAIANTIITKHGGTISIEQSSLGGPKFVISIPCEK
jgi:signal transduction histidine kinase